VNLHLKTHYEKTACGACAECARIRAKNWVIENPERYEAREKRYLEGHREQARIRSRKWYWNNREYAIAQASKRQRKRIERKQAERIVDGAA